MASQERHGFNTEIPFNDFSLTWEEKFKKLEQDKELNELLDAIKIFIQENRSNMDVVNVIMDKSKELGYDNPMAITNIDDAKTFLEFAQSIK